MIRQEIKLGYLQLNGALRNNSMLVITLLSSCTKLILPQSSNDTELYKQSPLVNYRTKTENNLHYFGETMFPVFWTAKLYYKIQTTTKTEK